MDEKKIIDALKKVDVKELAEPRPVFSDAEYALFKKSGLSQKEIETLENAELKRQIIELLPNDKADWDKLSAALDAVSNADTNINNRNLLLIAQKDPERLIQLLALTEIV